jgi:cephalosporin hydroxylase
LQLKLSFRSRASALVRKSLGEPGPKIPQTDSGNPYLRKDLDLQKLSLTSPTRFERIYYGHRGRPMFKWAHYLPIYDRLLAPFVGKPITLVEIGLADGGSLQLWREYLGPEIRIIGIDCDPKCNRYAEGRTEVIIGDQGDPAFMQKISNIIGEADIFIDDGSHIIAHQILTFESLFPIIKNGGVYVCEDLHTSYWPTYGGGLDNPDSFIGYSKRIIDKLHFKYGVGTLPSDDISHHIGAMVVTDSLIAFEKRPPEDVYMAWVGVEDAISD